MLKIGLTGGIGSGKTTVAHIFEVLGIAVYNADVEAKQIMHTQPVVVQQLKEAFGADIYTSGELDRKRLSGIVFNNMDKLRTLNSIVHPATIEHFKNWVLQQHAPYIIKEAALLFEANTYTECDYVITVTAPEDLRTIRVIHRDNVTAEQAYARMRNQWPEEEKIKRSNFVIVNDDKTLVTPQVLKIHQAIMSYK